MPLRYSANLTMLYPEAPFLERFDRAAAGGFKAVEVWFPYEAGIDAVKSRLEANGLSLVVFNLPPGDLPGEWGTLGNPGRRDFFRAGFNNALEAAGKLGCKRLHLMFGHQVEWALPEAQIDCALRHLEWAAPQAAQAGVTLMIEPLNPTDFPTCFLRTTSSAVDLVTRFSHPNVRLQYDIYHAQMSEGNLIHTITSCLPWIGHIQIADVPGRHQPGTGEINFPNVFAALERLKYGGYIGLEYRPRGTTEESLAWLPREARERN
jgi:hydroxypyruvate isomerase